MEKKIQGFWFNFIYIVILFFTIGSQVFLYINRKEHVWYVDNIVLFIVLTPHILFFIYLIFNPSISLNYNTKSLNYHSLISFRRINAWNRKIILSDVESIEIVNLTKCERKKHVGGKTIFHRYLKFDIVHNKQKYIPIAMFSEKQIKKILKYIQEIKGSC